MDNLIQDILKPEWNEIQRVREECQKYLFDHKFSSEIADAVTMVINELLENALKYGNYEDKNATISYVLRIGKNTIVVEVTNPTFGNDTPHFMTLDKTIQWIRGYQNPFEAYIEKLKEVSARPLRDKESGIGLVRVAYEGQSILDFYVRDDNRISVSAVYQLQ